MKPAENNAAECRDHQRDAEPVDFRVSELRRDAVPHFSARDTRGKIECGTTGDESWNEERVSSVCPNWRLRDVLVRKLQVGAKEQKAKKQRACNVDNSEVPSLKWKRR